MGNPRARPLRSPLSRGVPARHGGQSLPLREPRPEGQGLPLLDPGTSALQTQARRTAPGPHRHSGAGRARATRGHPRPGWGRERGDQGSGPGRHRKAGGAPSQGVGRLRTGAGHRTQRPPRAEPSSSPYSASRSRLGLVIPY